MAKVRKKVINTWDGGITTSKRSSNPETSYGAQMVKHFDTYSDPNRLVPMQSWTSFNKENEKDYGIRAMGGAGNTVYGIGSGLANWYGADWQYRIRVDIKKQYHRTSFFPIHINMEDLPADFWANVQEDMSDVRVTKKDGTTISPIHTENIDYANQTGDMWIDNSAVAQGEYTSTIVDDSTFTVTGSMTVGTTASFQGYSHPVTLDGTTFNEITLWAFRVGEPTAMKVDLYDDNAGSPDTLVQSLGEIDPVLITKDTTGTQVSVGFDDITLTGDYHIVVTIDTGDGSNYLSVGYGVSGSTTVKRLVMGTWQDFDTSATPYYKLNYIENISEPEKYFYVYYGNDDVSAVPYGINQLGQTFANNGLSVFNQFEWWYTFGDDRVSNNAYALGGVGTEESFTTEPDLFTDGYFGRAVDTRGKTILTDQDDNVGLNSNDISVSIMVYLESAPTSNTVIYRNANGNWDITIHTDRKVRFFVDGTNNNIDQEATLTIPLKKWTIIDCVFDSGRDIYIDGIKESFTTNSGAYDGTGVNERVSITTLSSMKVAQPMAFGNDWIENDVLTKRDNFFRSDFFSFGAQEDISNQSLIYDGLQQYVKIIGSTDWKERIVSGNNIKTMNNYPVNGFVDDIGQFFITSREQNYFDSGLAFLAIVDTRDALDAEHLQLVFGNTFKITPSSESPVDKSLYFTYGGASLGETGDPGNSNVFGAYSNIASLVAWRNYLAIGSTRRTRANVEIWDLNDTNPTEFVDAGTGNVRIVGNASDLLFAVVDNYSDDSVLSANNPTIEVKKYVGNGRMESVTKIELPTVYTGWSDSWERAVSTFKFRRNTETLFYAKLPSNDTATTFDEGLWAVGVNSQNQLALTLMIDTSEFDEPDNIFGFAKQVFYIQKDGGIQQLSTDGTYEKTSTYTTLKMNEGNSEIEKKLHGVEIVTEPLADGQTVSIYYRKENESSRTKLGDFTGEGFISKEFTESMPNYKEIEFDIETSGGRSAILEVNYRYEYLSDVV